MGNALEEDAVASRVARVADRAGYPGLVKEYKSLCDELQLPHPATMSALSWKRKVKHAVMNANRSYLLDQIERNYQKLDYETLKQEFELKEYVKNLCMHGGRMKFRIRAKMVKNVKFNFSSDPVYSSQLWHCTHCDMMDSQSHITKCESYKYLREGKDLSSDKDLVKYFSDVISLREKID